MAITVQTSPQAYTPAYNPQWFVCTSTQTAQPNFRYTVILTDVISGATVTRDIDADANGYLKADFGSFFEQYITQVNPANTYGFQLNTGAVRKCRVNVGETYGTTPTYYSGSNTDYIVWNASLDFMEMQNFTYTDKIYTQNNNIQLITNNHNPLYTWSPSASPEHYCLAEDAYAGRSSYLYCHTNTTGGSLEAIRVIGYDQDGVQLSSTLISNVYASSTTYTNKYFYIDVGYDGLLNMTGITSGTNPIPVSTLAYWIVYDESSWLPVNPDPVALPYTYPLKRFNAVCENRFDVTAVHYLSPEGSFETQLAQKLSLRTTEANKSYYSKLPFTLSGYNVTYTYGSRIENTLTGTSKDKITVNTTWLSEAQMEMLKDVISSPVVYADFGNSRGYQAMKVLNNSFTVTKKYNSQLMSASFDLEYAFTNVRQRG